MGIIKKYLNEEHPGLICFRYYPKNNKNYVISYVSMCLCGSLSVLFSVTPQNII
ncbi:MAG: hypothetical protein JWQ30_2519 [Sediminibacterium sp.]|nr:hypothetical protein [Sediminibacterium sp.]